jgi:hypothetical protein
MGNAAVSNRPSCHWMRVHSIVGELLPYDGQGVEDIKGKTPVVGTAPKIRLKLSKAELRQQAAAAFLAWRSDQSGKDK